MCLFCWLVLVYVDLITADNFFKSAKLNLLCGVTGAALYLTKAYGFPFFLLHFVILQGLVSISTQKALKAKSGWSTEFGAGHRDLPLAFRALDLGAV